MIFETRVHGIPCQCKVVQYYPALPMRITGSGFGDADPPEPKEIQIQLLDRKGREAPWLERKLKDEDIQRLHEEAEAAWLAERADITF